ncbi:NAD(P)-binding protein [Hesseltinella vesiculosa]|uniref:NAD(P)-binding protein n=1 Tax=Hesseltinella vesiculosa TaxID=101127 RepID=A0A1X2GEI9_9FUNG|nr:NAD(P)-binding protein [Hesseltinella vesiculosa]
MSRKLLVVGGSGFLGQSVCRAAVNKGWQTISLSRHGEPVQFSHQGKPHWADEVEWAQGDSLEPASYKDVLKGVTDVVHTVGIILESDYKKAVNDPSVFGALCGAGKVMGELVGMTDRGNPLDPQKSKGMPTYELINRDTAISLAKQVAQEPSMKTFAYISASDVFPLINPRYITSKREAEKYLFSRPEFNTIVLRPGFMYSENRSISLPLATALQCANAMTQPFAKEIASLPLGKSLTTPPLHIDTVAQATIHGLEIGSQQIYDVQDILALSK